jgi:hypothetical protein
MSDQAQNEAVGQAEEVNSALLEALVAEVLSRMDRTSDMPDPNRSLEEALMRRTDTEPREYSTDIQVDTAITQDQPFEAQTPEGARARTFELPEFPADTTKNYLLVLPSGADRELEWMENTCEEE